MNVTKVLKEATQDLHRQTEAGLPTSSLLDGSLATTDYLSLLSVQYQIFQSLETCLAKPISEHALLRDFYVFKTPWLEQDIRALGSALPPSLKESHLPFDIPALVGTIYVLEGSMLGGRFILKGLEKNERLKGLPHHFYHGHGEGTSAKWKQFKEIANQLVSPEEVGQAIERAQNVFRFFQKNFNSLAGHGQQNGQQ